MDFITELYVQILNLIKTIIGIFDGDTTVVDNLLAEIDKAEGEEAAPTV